MTKYYATKGLPWSSGIGKDVHDCVTSEEVMHKSKLNFQVEKCELVAKMPFSLSGNNEVQDTSDDFSHAGHIYRECPNAYATYRTDLNIPLGIVKSKYNVVQNIDAFKFFDDAIGENARWQYAGYYGNGEKVFITAKIKADFDVKGDPVESYLVFSNTHDGSGSINILFAPIRVFCTNMLNAALDNADSYIRIRHTKSAKDKINKGAEVLRIACEHAKNSKELYEALRMINMKDEQVRQYIANLILSESEKIALNAYDPISGYNRLYNRDYYTLEKCNISVRKANKIYAIWEYYNEGFGQKQIQGTAWGAYNAITGYYSNMENISGEKRMESLCYGGANKVMNIALLNAASYAKAV